MSEHPPKNLSRGQQRKVARTFARKEGLHAQTAKALEQAKEAHDRALYVEEGSLTRAVFGTRGKEYDKKVFGAAPVEETQDIPETGPVRRRAARAYSRAHDLSGQIKREKRRLKTLKEQTGYIQTGPVTRAIIGGRGKAYERSLYKNEDTKEGIEEALAEAKEKKLTFRTPKKRKIIDITPPAYTEREVGTSEVAEDEPSQIELETEGTGTDVDEEADFSAEAHTERIAADIRSVEDLITQNEVASQRAARRMMEREHRGFEIDAQRTGKLGKGVFWTRIGAFLKGLATSALLVGAGVGAKTMVERMNTDTDAGTPTRGETYSSTAPRVSLEEAEMDTSGGMGGTEETPLSLEEARDLLEQRPEGYVALDPLEEARLRVRAAEQNGIGGFEPPDAPPPREP